MVQMTYKKGKLLSELELLETAKTQGTVWIDYCQFELDDMIIDKCHTSCFVNEEGHVAFNDTTYFQEWKIHQPLDEMCSMSKGGIDHGSIGIYQAIPFPRSYPGDKQYILFDTNAQYEILTKKQINAVYGDTIPNDISIIDGDILKPFGVIGNVNYLNLT
jgi:hypothetical protein